MKLVPPGLSVRLGPGPWARAACIHSHSLSRLQRRDLPACTRCSKLSRRPEDGRLHASSSPPFSRPSAASRDSILIIQPALLPTGQTLTATIASNLPPARSRASTRLGKAFPTSKTHWAARQPRRRPSRVLVVRAAGRPAPSTTANPNSIRRQPLSAPTNPDRSETRPACFPCPASSRPLVIASLTTFQTTTTTVGPTKPRTEPPRHQNPFG